MYKYILNKDKEDGTVILSKPEVAKYNKAVSNAKIVLDTPVWKEKPTVLFFKNLASRMEKHTWLAGNEDSVGNQKAYMQYLNNEKNIQLPEGGKLFQGNCEAQLLGVDMKIIDTKTSGNIDVVLAASRHQSVVTTRQNMWAGIELKKDDNKRNAEIGRQVVLQHLSASYLNDDDGILTLMTDLCERWHFYWYHMGNKKKCRLMSYQATMTEARYLIHHMNDESSRGTMAPEGFLNRSSWKDIVGATHLDSATEENAEDDMDEQDIMDSDGEKKLDGAQKEGGSTQRTKYSGAHNSTASDRIGTQSGGKNCELKDASLDFMDDQDQKEAMFQAVLRDALPRMMHFPELAGEHSSEGIPKVIF